MYFRVVAARSGKSGIFEFGGVCIGHKNFRLRQQSAIAVTARPKWTARSPPTRFVRRSHRDASVSRSTAHWP